MITRLLLLIALLYTPSHGNSNLCNQSGFFRDPEDCQIFYRCVNWYGNSFTSFQFSCPLGTAFDDRINVCNHIGLVPGCTKSKPLIVDNRPLETESFSEFSEEFSSLIVKPTKNPFLTTTTRAPTIIPSTPPLPPLTPPSPTTIDPRLTSPRTTTTTTTTRRPFEPLFGNEPSQSPLLASEPDNSSYKVDPLSLYPCPEPGFYPYEKNCNEFYVCQEVLPGILISEQLYSCPQRYLFDPETLRCQRASKVTCPKRPTEEEEGVSAKTSILVVHEQFLDLFFSTPLNYYSSRTFDS